MKTYSFHHQLFSFSCLTAFSCIFSKTDRSAIAGCKPLKITQFSSSFIFYLFFIFIKFWGGGLKFNNITAVFLCSRYFYHRRTVPAIQLIHIRTTRSFYIFYMPIIWWSSCSNVTAFCSNPKQSSVILKILFTMFVASSSITRLLLPSWFFIYPYVGSPKARRNFLLFYYRYVFYWCRVRTIH